MANKAKYETDDSDKRMLDSGQYQEKLLLVERAKQLKADLGGTGFYSLDFIMNFIVEWESACKKINKTYGVRGGE